MSDTIAANDSSNGQELPNQLISFEAFVNLLFPPMTLALPGPPVPEALPCADVQVEVPGELFFAGSSSVLPFSDAASDRDRPLEGILNLAYPLTPEQLSWAHQKRSTASGERRLMAAVLEDAVSTFQRFAFESGRPATAVIEELLEWLNSTDETYLYSFINICNVLDFDPDWLRTGLMHWRMVNRPKPRVGREREIEIA